jgi:hypothetical protein
MEIKVVEAPPTPLRQMTPAEVAEGRNTVSVWLERPITLQIDESTLVTYSPGEHQAPCEIANALFAQGAERVGPDGCFIKRDVPKPTQTRVPNPFGGVMRFPI